MKTVRLVLINLAVLLTLLITLELVLRFTSNDKHLTVRTYPEESLKNKPEFPLFSKYFRSDDSLGWVCKTGQFKGLASVISSQPSRWYEINHQGFRNPFDFDSIEAIPHQKRVLFIGDSFIFSLFLNEEESIRQLVQEKLGNSYLCLNLGIPGYGIDQSSLSFFKYYDQLQPDVVIMLYIDDDVSRVLESKQPLLENFNKPSYTVENNILVRRTNSKNIFIKACESLHILNPFYRRYLKKEKLAIAEKFIENVGQKLKKDNKSFTVMRCPTLGDMDRNEPHRGYSFEHLFEDQSNFKDLSDAILEQDIDYRELYLEGDGHPSAKGAKFIADQIIKAVLPHDTD